MRIQIINVNLSNSPGALSRITGFLSDDNVNINIYGIGLAETKKSLGSARMAVSDPVKARRILMEKGENTCKIEDAEAFCLDNTPGMLHKLASALDRAGINIQFMNSLLGGANQGKAILIAGFNGNWKQAVEVMESCLGSRALKEDCEEYFRVPTAKKKCPFSLR